MDRNKNIGEKGEKIAFDYLVTEGYEIVEKNWRNGHHEIDLIAFKDNTYIFIEVKTRLTAKLGMPEKSITKSKIRSVTQAAGVYLLNKQYKNVRFDVIAIYLPTKGEMDFLHIKDAFY